MRYKNDKVKYKYISFIFILSSYLVRQNLSHIERFISSSTVWDINQSYLIFNVMTPHLSSDLLSPQDVILYKGY